MSKETEAAALERFEPYRHQDSLLRFRDVLAARIETYRDLLEKEDSEKVRGQLTEARKLFNLLSE